MKYYLIAGEASGDLHGAYLMKAILKNDPQAQFRFWGGDKMQAVGGTMAKHYRDLAFMGFAEVLMNIRIIRKNFTFCKQELLNFSPDVVVLIDYPGFNLRMTKFAHKMGLKVVFYISPTIWAWKQSRVYQIKKYVDRMLVILPFEKDFYARYGYEADFVGHPLLDEIENETFPSRENFLNQNELSDKPLIAVLPGSRKQEIRKMLPELLAIAPQFPRYQFVVAGVKSVPKDVYPGQRIPVVFDQTHVLLHYAEAALVTSGTATLEAALLGAPQVVCYKLSMINYWIARLLVHVKFISLVNLILDKEVVKELIQSGFSERNLLDELRDLLENKEKRQKIKKEYALLKTKLGNRGASEKAAAVIADVLKN